MANHSLWNAPDIVPSIPYSDLPRAVEWFERVFGFRERVEARLIWPGGGMAWLEVGGAMFSITAAGEAVHNPKAVAPGLVMKAYVEDVDKHFARAPRPEGAKIISALEDGFWGGRIYRVLDHEGYPVGDFPAWPRLGVGSLATASRHDPRRSQVAQLRPPHHRRRAKRIRSGSPVPTRLT